MIKKGFKRRSCRRERRKGLPMMKEPRGSKHPRKVTRNGAKSKARHEVREEEKRKEKERKGTDAQKKSSTKSLQRRENLITL
jgi:hypothetical protein